MKKFLIFIALSLCLVLPTQAADEQFTARIVDVTEQYIRVEDKQGNRYTIDPANELKESSTLHSGDRVIISHIKQEGGGDAYIIQEFVRTPWVIALVCLFLTTIILVNGKKGIRSIINIIVTGIIILFVIIPLILKGYSPVIVTIVGGMIAMAWSIYFSEGFTKKSHTAIISIAISLFIGAILSWIFVAKTSLSGFSDESSTILAGIGYEHIKMRGLLLAAIIIGALGVIDDVAISQASIVHELKEANPTMKPTLLFQAALRVGRDHTGAVVNTLVLAYVGAAFPLIILLSLRQAPFDTAFSIFNNEIVATELVRTIIGSISIMLVMPISTWTALFLEKPKKKTGT